MLGPFEIILAFAQNLVRARFGTRRIQLALSRPGALHRRQRPRQQQVGRKVSEARFAAPGALGLFSWISHFHPALLLQMSLCLPMSNNLIYRQQNNFASLSVRFTTWLVSGHFCVYRAVNLLWIYMDWTTRLVVE